METTKIKHDWKRLDEPNGGHTPNEWGMQESEKKIRIIQCYKLRYENL